jgi:hypothetical protein
MSIFAVMDARHRFDPIDPLDGRLFAGFERIRLRWSFPSRQRGDYSDSWITHTQFFDNADF